MQTIGLYNHTETKLRNCSVNSSPVTVPKVLKQDLETAQLILVQSLCQSCLAMLVLRIWS